LKQGAGGRWLAAGTLLGRRVEGLASACAKSLPCA
jgi:hypothetical protein